MKVYNYNNQGYLIGISELDESDKCKITGNWLIPGMATEKEPLEAKEGYEVKFNGKDWQYIKLLSIEDRKIAGEIPLGEGEKIENETLIKIEKPSTDCVWDNESKEWLTLEMQKIQGLLPLEDGEKIVDGALVTVEKPSNYYVWNYTTFEWEYNSEIRKSEIYAELESIDTQTIRPLRAKLTGPATTQDESKLLELETKANTLRNELKTL